MSTWTSEDSAAAEEIRPGDVLLGNFGQYNVLKFIGEGCFGKVARCQNLQDGDMMAVKVMSKKDSESELAMLKAISILDPDQNNLVKFFECFEDLGHTCLVFEMLDSNLYSLLEQRHYVPLSLKELRSIAVQLLLALEALRGISILHTDLKPDNIMLVRRWPLRVKVIDFGLAMPTSQGEPGQIIQARGYRAPEIDLGLPFWEPIDVWSVGCVLAMLYLAQHLFPLACDYQRMRFLVEVLGQPDDQQLQAGIYTRFFFKNEGAAEGSKWRLLTPEEYTRAYGIAPGKRERKEQISSLEDLVHISPVLLAGELEDRRAFVSLLSRMLDVEAAQRIRPRPALQLPFLSMSHLQQPELRDYLISSKIHMAGCSDSSSPPSKSSSPPSKSSSPLAEPSSPPVKSSTPPAHSSPLPHHSSSPPPDSSSPPCESSSAPAQSSFLPVKSSTPRAHSSPLPHHSSSPPPDSSSPPAQSNSPPAQSSSPPSESSFPPAQSSTLVQPSFLPAHSSSPPSDSSSPPHQSSSPPKSSSLPEFSSPPSHSVFPGCLKKVWRRMRRIFSSAKPKLCCCLRPSVEE